MTRVLGATANIFISFLLGTITLVFVAVQFPEIMQYLLDAAGWLTDQITNTGLEPKYNIWLMFLIEDRQFVFLGFVIMTRIILASVMPGVRNLLGSGRRY